MGAQKRAGLYCLQKVGKASDAFELRFEESSSARWKGESRELEVPKQESRAQDGSLDTTPGSVLQEL